MYHYAGPQRLPAFCYCAAMPRIIFFPQPQSLIDRVMIVLQHLSISSAKHRKILMEFRTMGREAGTGIMDDD